MHPNTLKHHIKIFKNSIEPKILSVFEGKQKELWKAKLNILLPKNNLGYKDEKEFLNEKNLTKEDIIKNSIKYIDANIDNDDLESLTDMFLIFSINTKIRVIDNTPIYIEVINSLSYIKRIQEILNKFPKYDSDYLGTRHRQSSNKKLLKTQLNSIKDRIEGRFFKLTNESEIKKVQSQINIIELALTEKYKNLPSWLNHWEIYIGLKSKLVPLNDIQIETIQQLNSFFNGLKTSKEELLKSVCIFLRANTNISNDETKYHQELAKNIMDILLFYFKDTIKEVNKDKKRTFTYSKNSIKKEHLIKTNLDELPIYTSKNQNTNDHYMELVMESYKGIMGLPTIFDNDDSNVEEISDYTATKNLIKYFKTFGLTNKEYKTFRFISKYIQKNQIN